MPQASDSALAQSTSPLPSSSSARRRRNGISLGWISNPSGPVLSALSVVRSRPHIAEASTGAGVTGARRAIWASEPLSPSRCIWVFFSAQSRSSSSRVMTPVRTRCSP